MEKKGVEKKGSLGISKWRDALENGYRSPVPAIDHLTVPEISKDYMTSHLLFLCRPTKRRDLPEN